MRRPRGRPKAQGSSRRGGRHKKHARRRTAWMRGAIPAAATSFHDRAHPLRRVIGVSPRIKVERFTGGRRRLAVHQRGTPAGSAISRAPGRSPDRPAARSAAPDPSTKINRGGSLVKRHVGPEGWKHPEPRLQEKRCEGPQTPGALPATVSRRPGFKCSGSAGNGSSRPQEEASMPCPEPRRHG